MYHSFPKRMGVKAKKKKEKKTQVRQPYGQQISAIYILLLGTFAVAF